MTAQKENASGQTTNKPSAMAVGLAHELYDRFVMGGWEPQDAHAMISDVLKAEAVDWIRKDAEVDDMLVMAIESARESVSEDPNSYGAGYDEGYREGLRSALEVMRSENDE